MSASLNNSEKKEVKDLMLLFYLMPVFGVGPAMWTLSRPDRSLRERALSRLAIKLMLAWFVGTVALDVGVENVDALKLPLLIVSSIFTSGYFVLNLGLMLRLWQGRSIDLPLLGRVNPRDSYPDSSIDPNRYP
jgi:hypothetical protein